MTKRKKVEAGVVDNELPVEDIESGQVTDDAALVVESKPVATEEERLTREEVEHVTEEDRLAAEAAAEAERLIQEELARVVAEEAEKERLRLVFAESQKEQSFRCWHHLLTCNKPREEVGAHLLLLEPEAMVWGKEKVESELAALEEEKKKAEAKGFSVAVTIAEVSGYSDKRSKSGRR